MNLTWHGKGKHVKKLLTKNKPENKTQNMAETDSVCLHLSVCVGGICNEVIGT